MNFLSDNTAGVSPPILKAIAGCNTGNATAYGDDDWTRRLQSVFAGIFDKSDLSVFPVISGTAANALALATIVKPHGSIICHQSSHIHVDECGAPELFTHGAKLLPLAGRSGKLVAGDVSAILAGADAGDVHQTQPMAVSVSQSTESGTVYSPDELKAISRAAKKGGCLLHMDGARFANALVSTKATPAELTWKSGVDILSFGATKNGAMAAEAVVFFDPRTGMDFPFLRKKSGHLLSKMRFVSAQLEAYIAKDLWLSNARHANDMAQKLASGLSKTPGAALLFDVEANEIFVTLPDKTVARLKDMGALFYEWDAGGKSCLRLVTSFATTNAEIEAFLKAVAAGD